MTNKIVLFEYGAIISDVALGEKIYNDIKEALKEGDVVLDFENIRSMATFTAKQIFGRLYLEMGSELFFEKIELKNVSDNIKLIIRIGVQNALEDQVQKKDA